FGGGLLPRILGKIPAANRRIDLLLISRKDGVIFRQTAIRFGQLVLARANELIELRTQMGIADQRSNRTMLSAEEALVAAQPDTLLHIKYVVLVVVDDVHDAED